MLHLVAGCKVIAAILGVVGSFWSYTTLYDERPWKAMQGYATLGAQLASSAPAMIMPGWASESSTVLDNYHQEHSELIWDTDWHHGSQNVIEVCVSMAVDRQVSNTTRSTNNPGPTEQSFTSHFQMPPINRAMDTLNITAELRIGFIGLALFFVACICWRYYQQMVEEKAQAVRQLEAILTSHSSALAGMDLDRNIVAGDPLECLKHLRKRELERIGLWKLSLRIEIVNKLNQSIQDLEQKRKITALEVRTRNLTDDNRRYRAQNETLAIKAQSSADLSSELGSILGVLDLRVQEPLAQVQGLVTRSQDLESVKKNLTTQTEELTAQKAALEADKKDLSDRLEAMKTQYQDSTALNGELEADKKSLQVGNEGLVTENGDLSASIESMKAEIQELCNRLKVGSHDRGRLSKEASDGATLYESAVQESDVIKSERDKALEQLNTAKANNTELFKLLDEAVKKKRAERGLRKSSQKVVEAQETEMASMKRTHEMALRDSRAPKVAKDKAMMTLQGEVERLEQEVARLNSKNSDDKIRHQQEMEQSSQAKQKPVKKLQAPKSQGRTMDSGKGSKEDQDQDQDQDQTMEARKRLEVENTELKTTLSCTDKRVGELQAQLDGQKVYIQELMSNYGEEIGSLQQKAFDEAEARDQKHHEEKMNIRKEEEDTLNRVIDQMAKNSEAKMREKEAEHNQVVAQMRKEWEAQANDKPTVQDATAPTPKSATCNCQYSQDLLNKHAAKVISYEEDLLNLREASQAKDVLLARFGLGPQARASINAPDTINQGSHNGALPPQHSSTLAIHPQGHNLAVPHGQQFPRAIPVNRGPRPYEGVIASRMPMVSPSTDGVHRHQRVAPRELAGVQGPSGPSTPQ
ncbi:MAG: hypothetical protein Q9202_000837 [Teloschistes flavicans]